MKKSVVWIIVIIIILILVGSIYFIGIKTTENLKKTISKRDPETGKTPVILIAELDDEGLERAGVTNSESELIIDFMIESIGMYDWEKIDNAWQELQEAGVTEEEYLLFVSKITELAMNGDFDELNKIGVTEEKIQLYIDNWDQEKAEAFVTTSVQNTVDAGVSAIEKASQDIGNLP